MFICFVVGTALGEIYQPTAKHIRIIYFSQLDQEYGTVIHNSLKVHNIAPLRAQSEGEERECQARERAYQTYSKWH